MTNILYIIDCLVHPAGTEKHLYELVRHLDRNKYTPFIIAFESSDYFKKSFFELGVKVTDINIKKIYGLKQLMLLFKLRKFIKKEEIKIVQLFHTNPDIYGTILARFSGVPVIISSRRDLGFNRNKRNIFCYKLLNRFVTKIICVSDAVKQLVIKEENVPEDKFEIIYNGVDLAFFDKDIDRDAVRKSFGFTSEQPVIGMLANFGPIKGHIYFLESARIVKNIFPDAQFLLAGRGDREHELRNKVKTLGLDDSVHFLGSRKDIPEVLTAMDILVVASLSEGFSNTILEALVMKKAVVATNVGGNPEIIIDGQSGLLVPPKDPLSMAEAIKRLINDKALFNHVRDTGRKIIDESFTMSKMVDKTQSLYEKLLSFYLKTVSWQKVLPLFYIIKNVVKYGRGLFGKNIVNRIRKIHTRLPALLKINIANFAYYSGFSNFIIRHIPAQVVILSYHQVNDNNFDPLNLHVGQDMFRATMVYIKNRYNVISLEQACDIIQNRRTLKEHSIVVTFDDGYKDNYINAFPVLKHYNIPATIFLAVEAIDKQDMLWYDIIVKAFEFSPAYSVDLSDFGLSSFRLDTQKQRMLAAAEVVNFCKSMSDFKAHKRCVLVDTIVKRLELTKDMQFFSSNLLNWQEIKEMSKDGISFGSHGMTHTILSKLNPQEIEKEVRDSKYIIEQNLGQEIKYFAYPNGNYNDFDNNTIEMLKLYGYKCGLTLIRGANYSCSMFALRRICMNEDISATLMRKFSKTRFGLELLGGLLEDMGNR